MTRRLGLNWSWEREFDDMMREAAARSQDCDWHTHSIFWRCQNGLSLREYLHGR